MRTPGRRGVVTALAILLGLGIATAQRLSHPAALNAQGNVEGSLTVTIIVASSVGVVIGPDGQQHLVTANSWIPPTTFHEFNTSISARRTNTSRDNQTAQEKIDHRQSLGSLIQRAFLP